MVFTEVIEECHDRFNVITLECSKSAPFYNYILKTRRRYKSETSAREAFAAIKSEMTGVPSVKKRRSKADG